MIEFKKGYSDYAAQIKEIDGDDALVDPSEDLVKKFQKRLG